MPRYTAGIFGLLMLSLTLLAADEAPSLSERAAAFAQIKMDIQADFRKAFDAYDNAKTESAKEAAWELNPTKKSAIYQKPLLKLIEVNPKDDLSLTMLLTLVNQFDADPISLRYLTVHHSRNPRMIEAFYSCKSNDATALKSFLEALLEWNPNHSIQGLACYRLAEIEFEYAQKHSDKAALAEAEKRLERTIRDYGDVKKRVAEMESLSTPIQDIQIRDVPLRDLAKPLLKELRVLQKR